MDQSEVNDRILQKLDNVAEEVSNMRVIQSGLNKEHERMNDLLDVHIKATKLIDGRVVSLEDESKARKVIRAWLKDKRTWALAILGAAGTVFGIMKYLKIF